MNFDDNKLKDALKKVCDALWVSLPTLNYYDFRYPNANKVMIIVDEINFYNSYGGFDSFKFMIPEEVARNTSKMYLVSHVYSCDCRGDDIGNYVKLGSIKIWGDRWKELTFAQPGVPGDIKPGNYYYVDIRAGADYGRCSCHAQGGILLIYRE